LPEFSLTPTRRWLLLGVLIATGAVLLVVGDREDRTQPARGVVSSCARLQGDAARACYSREVGRELAAVGSTGAPKITFSAPADSTEVRIASVAAEQPLLCDLHARVGVVDSQVPSWLGWNEPLAQPASTS
jgi:hypothetical protein